jgi:hypothetical protein
MFVWYFYNVYVMKIDAEVIDFQTSGIRSTLKKVQHFEKGEV